MSNPSFKNVRENTTAVPLLLALHNEYGENLEAKYRRSLQKTGGSCSALEAQLYDLRRENEALKARFFNQQANVDTQNATVAAPAVQSQKVTVMKECLNGMYARCEEKLSTWQLVEAPAMVESPDCTIETISGKNRGIDWYVAKCTGTPTRSYLQKLGIVK